jgi:hypothetical protein
MLALLGYPLLLDLLTGICGQVSAPLGYSPGTLFVGTLFVGPIEATPAMPV